MGLLDWFWKLDRATPVSPLVAAALDTAAAAESARVKAIADAWAAYRGVFPDPLTTDPGEPDDNVKVNHQAPIVDAGVAYLFSPPPELHVRDGFTKAADGTQTPTPAETWLQAWLAAANFKAFALDLATNGAVGGTAYAKLTAPTVRGGWPGLHTQAPEEMTIRTDPRNIDRVLAYSWAYNTLDPATGKPIVVRQVTRRQGAAWEIEDSSRFLDTPGDRWTVESVTTWPYPWAPVDHCKNMPAPNEVYGSPDITDALVAANEAHNLALSNWNRVNRLHGHPWSYITGVNPNQVHIDSGPNKIIVLPDPASKIGRLPPSVDGAGAGQLGRELYELICEMSGTPSIVLGRSEQNAVPPSGVALRIKMRPLLQRTEKKRVLYEPLLVRLAQHALELGGFGGCEVVVTWPELIPTDPLAERQTLLADLAAGLTSRQTAAEKAGYDWAQEQTRLTQEAATLPAPVQPAIPTGTPLGALEQKAMTRADQTHGL